MVRTQSSNSGNRRGAAPQQLDLVPPPALRAAPPSETLRALARALPPRLYLGTSSWSFPGWKHLVYDATYTPTQLSQRGLTAYAQHPLLRTVGIDSAHYAPLPPQVLQQYAAQTPAEFRFLMKAHEACTLARYPAHKRYGARAGENNPLFLDADYATRAVVAPWTTAMQQRAGVLLFQFAAQDVAALGGPTKFARRLGRFLAALPTSARYAVELRNADLVTPAYARALAEHNAVHCFNVHPSMPTIGQQQRAMGNPRWPRWVLRWMLQADLRYDEAITRYRPFGRIIDPDPVTRKQVAALIRYATGHDMPVFVIVNNKAEGCAPQSIAALAAEVAAHPT